MSWQVAAITLTGSDQAIAYKTYHGITVAAAGAAGLTIYNNTTNSGTILEVISFAAAGCVSLFYEKGIRADLGIYVDITSGTLTGSVRVS